MEITFEDVMEFVIKNSDHREWMDKLNKITFPFTTSYENKYWKKNDFKIWWRYEPSYDDLRDSIERDEYLVDKN